MENKVLNDEVINEIINDFKTQNIAEQNLPDELKAEASTSVCDNTKELAREQVLSKGDCEGIIEDINDETLQSLEGSMSDEDKEKCKQKAIELKVQGNKKFSTENYIESINLYTQALNTCPLSYKNERSIFYCNRAAAKIKLGYDETAIGDCTKAIDLNPNYIKAYLRRAKLYEKTDKLDESLKDFTKILEFEPFNNEARAASIKLPPMINERNEKLKEEMLGKLKDLGNLVLKPFGLSTENFKLQQDPNSGSYSVNFQQNHKR